MTQDPKVEVRSVTNPDLAETWVTLHFRSDTTGVLGVSGTALAGGVPILIDFPTLGEWIAPPQATANAVAARTASEALA
jgi:hypothetical protein